MRKPDMQEIKAFVPARDFNTALSFYQDMGFEVASNQGGFAYLKYDNCSFMLQDFYVAEHSNNFMMHILVDNLDIWYDMIKSSGLVEKYVVCLTDIKTQHYGMRDFTLTDPSGVLWCIGEELKDSSHA
ncbi:VOC family protein [Undibacterium hunanense]|nr:VOC family protein [Undibacterium hunanense]